jgi:pilus assembly protein FimV
MIVRSSRPLHSQPRRYSRTLRAALVAASLVGVLSGTAASFDAHAQASAAQAASSASSAGISASGTQYTVKPGQSVTDVAGEITGSTDKTVRENMARALFDANPNAFMHHDPSKMRLGAVLNVPSTGDGSAGASSSVAASAPGGVAASGPSAAVAAPVTPASMAAAASTPAAATAAPAASTVKEANSVESAAAPSGVASNVNGTLEGASASGAVAVGASGGVGASDAAVATSEAQPVAASAAAENATPASTASTEVAEGSDRLPIGLLAGVVILIALLVFAWRLAKRRRYARTEAERSAVERGSSGESPVVSTEGPLIETRDASLAEHSDVPATTGAADLEGIAVQRGQSELNGVAASIESYEAAQAFETPIGDDAAVLEPSTEGHVENIVDEPAGVAEATSVGEVDTGNLPSAPGQDADDRRAPFMPDAPAALHRAFTPPRPGSIEAERIAAEKAAAEQEAAEREAALREEAQAREQAEREAIEAEAPAAAQREAEAREAEAREQAEREAEARAVAQRDAEAAREAEAREAQAREQAEREAREAEAGTVAPREAEAREAEAREAEAGTVAPREAAAREQVQREAQEAEARAALPREEQAREPDANNAIPYAASPVDLNAPIQPDHPQHSDDFPQHVPHDSVPQHNVAPGNDAQPAHPPYDDEPSPASRLPKPTFPREAIEALNTLELGLPPRQEAPLDGNAPVHAFDPPPTTPIEAPPITPQPIAEPAVYEHQNAQLDGPIDEHAQSVGQQIEGGTTGPASVAGLGASRFGPLSLDFDYNLPASQTDPIPAFTPQQIAMIARNKLDLAVEYIELGDLSGARTLLQEVIESNDHATRQPAATLLSTLAPLS